MARYRPLIVGFNGSPHYEGSPFPENQIDGIVVQMLKGVLEGAEATGARIEIVNLYSIRNIIPEPGLYSRDPELVTAECMPPDGMTALFPLIREADGLVFATPNYWAGMSGMMKLLIEHITPISEEEPGLCGKVAAFIAASKENEGGVEMAAMSMVVALCQMGVVMGPWSVLWWPGGQYATAEGPHHDWALEDAPSVGGNMVRLARAIRRTNPFRFDE